MQRGSLQQQMHFSPYFNSTDITEVPTTTTLGLFPHFRQPTTASDRTPSDDLPDSSNDTLCHNSLHLAHATSMDQSMQQYHSTPYPYQAPGCMGAPLMPMQMHMQQPAAFSGQVDAHGHAPPLPALGLDPDPILPGMMGAAWEPAGGRAPCNAASTQLLHLQRFPGNGGGGGGSMQFTPLPGTPATLALAPASQGLPPPDTAFGLTPAAARLHDLGCQPQQEHRQLSYDMHAELDTLLAPASSQYDGHYRQQPSMYREQRYKFDDRGGSGDGPGWALDLASAADRGGTGGANLPLLRAAGGLDPSATPHSQQAGAELWPRQPSSGGGGGLPLLQGPGAGVGEALPPLRLQVKAEQQPGTQLWHRALNLDDAGEESGGDSPQSPSTQSPHTFGGGGGGGGPPDFFVLGKAELGAGSGGAAGSPSSSPRYQRLRWTPELHDDFMRCLDELGGEDKATPTTIWRLMKHQGLGLHHIKSHLQKHRLGLKQEREKERRGPRAGAGGQQQQQQQQQQRRMRLVEEAAAARAARGGGGGGGGGLSRAASAADVPSVPPDCPSPPHTGPPEDPDRSFRADAVITLCRNLSLPSSPALATATGTKWRGTGPRGSPTGLGGGVVGGAGGAPLIAPGSWDSINSAMQAQRKMQLQLRGQVQEQHSLEQLLDLHSNRLNRLVTLPRPQPSGSARPPAAGQAAPAGNPPLGVGAAADRQLQGGQDHDPLGLLHMGLDSHMQGSPWM